MTGTTPLDTDPSGTSASPSGAPIRAAMIMLFAVAAFSLMDAGLKSLAATYPPLQVATLRGWRHCCACAGPCTCCAVASASG